MSGSKPMGGPLSPTEQIEVAFYHFVRGDEQQRLAEIYAVNVGRINEACKRIGAAVGITPPGYQAQEDK